MFTVLVLSAVAIGCGGGSEDEGTAATGASGTTGAATTAAGPAKAEFVKQADAICKRGGDEIHQGAEALKKRLGVEPTASLNKSQKEELIEAVVVPAVKKQAEGVAKLAPPPGDEIEVNELVAALGRVANAGQEDPGNILTTAGTVGAVNEVAENYGASECVQP
jgi:hypothetical protein